MEIINRPKYISEIEKFIDKPVVKIITGMRRVGKSTILNLIKDHHLKDIDEENKISINFESLEYMNITDASSLSTMIKDKVANKEGKIYFFFDEIQLVKDWQRVINGLRVDMECDIFITGSNSTLLSGDLATLLAGRYVEFEIQPFTFDEFTSLYANDNKSIDDLFNDFIRLGGMPAIKYFNLEEEPSLKYLGDIYNTVVVKDVLAYNKIRDVDLFNRILLFAIENIGSTFSALSIRKYLKSEGRDISVDSTLNYLQYCQNAFIIKKVPRYDTVGKSILKVEEKYYLTDHGMREAKGFSNVKDIERVLENIVYIELLSRGYEVSIGKVNNLEIDFIASKNKEKIYFQISYLMASEGTRAREFGVYQHISDNYPKYVLSMDKLDFSQDGIRHMNIIDFLLGNER